jgi:hypothetical protein
VLDAAARSSSGTPPPNKPFSAWGEVFGDEVVATVMVDRLVHHAEILSLKGDSYRLRARTCPPGAAQARATTHEGGAFSTVGGGCIFDR